VGTFGPAQLATLRNVGGAALKISSIGVSGDFYDGNNCGSTLAPGASCTLRVTFTPTSGGTRSGTVTIADNAPGSPHKLPLSGTGAGTGSIKLQLSPASLTFGSVAVGTTSSPQTVTLTNIGKVAASFLDPFGFATTGTNWRDFHKQPSNCEPSLAPGKSCTVTVTFKPLASGTRTAFFLVRQGAASVKIPLTGTGIGTTGATINLATGLDCSNKLITTGGQQDCHWTVKGNPAQVVAPGNADWSPWWTSDGPNSDWIAINANNCCNGPAPYTFNLTFDLSGYNLATVSLSGLWAIDDQGTLSLNGNTIATLAQLYSYPFHSFSVPAGSPFFKQGSNTLSITMTWDDNDLEGVRLEGTLTGSSATPAPDLTNPKTHTGNFVQGQTAATYTIGVSNVGSLPSSGTVTATDTLSAGLVATAMAGAGWACTVATLTCARSDVLNAGAPATRPYSR